MKFYVHRALANGVVLESIRRKDLWVVAILGFIVLAASSAIGFFGSAGLETFVKDLAVTVLGLFSTVIAVVVSCRVLPEEIKNRTLYPLLARPITRLDLILGKWVGAVLVTWLGFLLLLATTAVALIGFHVHFEAIMLQYAFLKMLGLAVICSVGMALSVYMTPSAATVMTFVLALGSSILSRAMTMAYEQSPEILRGLFKVFNAMLPQVHLFDIGARATYMGWSPVPMWVVAALVVYLFAYASAMMAVCFAKFRRQAL